jgi:hypothetical protein
MILAVGWWVRVKGGGSPQAVPDGATVWTRQAHLNSTTAFFSRGNRQTPELFGLGVERAFRGPVCKWSPEKGDQLPDPIIHFRATMLF